MRSEPELRTMPSRSPRTGARLLVEALAGNGVERVFAIPGESYLAVLDALADSPIATVVCRHESGAAMMADCTGRLTGRPGIAFVTRGPGATNAAAGLHVAMQDSSPMILFVGQIERGMRHREAFQEIDYGRFFGATAKWVAEIDSAERVPEMVSRAFHVATSGRPGPVVLALPEDMLVEEADVAAARPWTPVETHPGLNLMWDLQKRLWAAKRPLAILGGSRWSERACRQFQRFAEKFSLPVAVSFRRQMLFDHEHPLYCGDIGFGLNPKLRARIAEADLVLMVGGRFSEVPSQGYELLAVPEPRQSLVHVHADAGELGRVYHPELAINATPAAFAAAAESLEPPPAGVAWTAWAEAARADYRAWTDVIAPTPGAVDYGEVFRTLARLLPDDAILTNGAGNYAIWLHRYWRFRRYATQGAPTSGSMGYGLPAAIAAKLAFPDRKVVCFAGDGCFQMTGLEFGTACQLGLPLVVVLVDNGLYGTIRMHQEREYPGRVAATTLANPDFARWAESYGALGLRVETTADVAPALAAALAADRPALVHLRLDPEAISPTTTLSALRAASLMRKNGEDAKA
jgi:acetolactate synthase-1/2/3 large subunit